MKTKLSQRQKRNQAFQAFHEEQAEGATVKSPTEIIISGENHDVIASVLNTLTMREANILTLRFGLDGNEPMTLRSIAALYNRSATVIRLVEAKALRKLRHPYRSIPLAAITDFPVHHSFLRMPRPSH